NMYKIAGEMLPAVFHVTARALAAQSLSIFGDHADVMACRATGFAMTSAASIQETHDMAIVAHLATLESKVPFLAFFDGFRTSHEYQKVELLDYEDMKSLLDMKYVEEFRARALRPEAPYAKMAAQNPDVYFQGRESTNNMYDAVPAIVQKYMDKVSALTGRPLHLFDYVGAPDADKVIIVMGSACEVIEEAIDYLNARGEKLGLIKVRLFRPFSAEALVKAIPASVKKIAVLDRTKEPGSLGEPLYLDVKSALATARPEITVVGGRFGLASKEFTPSMVLAVYRHLDGACFHNFSVGINDDVSHRSLPINETIVTEPAGTTACMFWGLGSDGTVGSNKNSVAIIGDNTDKYVQAYFAYDSKKSGGITISHLRFGDKPITSEYLITAPNFVACHNPAYIGMYDMLGGIKEGGTFLLNTAATADQAFATLTREMQEIIVSRKIRFFVVDALKVALEVGSPKYISTIMQTCFFKLAGIIPEEKAIGYIKSGIEKKFAKKGQSVVDQNKLCVDKALDGLCEVKIPASLDGVACYTPADKFAGLGEFANKLMKPVLAQKGDTVPVSAMSIDGSMPTGTARFEKRGVAPKVPQWDPSKCVQCNQCVMSCPHAAIRAKLIKADDLAAAPASFATVDAKSVKEPGLKYRIQVYVDDCLGCGVCVETCIAKEKALSMVGAAGERKAGQQANVTFFNDLPDSVMGGTSESTVKGLGFKLPYFEFNGACAGCGEAPYVKLVSQLFGNRMIVANATGCSSIYSGSFPSLPYCKDKAGRGPAWANSLFEDNAEYGFGMRVAVDNNRRQLMNLIKRVQEIGVCCDKMKAALDYAVANWDKTDEAAIANQNELGELLKVASQKAEGEARAIYTKMLELKDYFVDKSVWIIGGDGWAYDIGYGG
ncbi:MAG: pyruvate:ferredoxin (flavodoxin) oxidoreductase, partial [Kiritimatiellae bacterium]|nr:pyruvate:ferredoxin (flavodoxin) oxidoreductase [Kiritimatiellia bacterium]